MDLIGMMPHSPFRIPSWRYQRATELVEEGKRLRPKFDDAWVARTKTFLATNRATELGKPHRHARDEALARAFAIFNGPASIRGRLEGYLLTHATLDHVAARCRLQVETISAFEAVFFSVRGHLGSRDWIMFKVVGLPSPSAYRADQTLVWKTLAYFGGLQIFEIALAVTCDLPLLTPSGVRPAEAAAWAATMRFRCRLLIAAMTAETPAELTGLVQIAAKVRNGFDERTDILSLNTDLLNMFGPTETKGLSQKPKSSARPQSASLPLSPVFNLGQYHGR